MTNLKISLTFELENSLANRIIRRQIEKLESKEKKIIALDILFVSNDQLLDFFLIEFRSNLFSQIFLI